MKRIFVILWLAGWTPLLAQYNAFVLVDVSGNPLEDPYKITPPMRQEAIALTRAIITNNYNSSFNNNWRQTVKNPDPRITGIMSGQGRPLIDPGGLLMIMPFGERDTYKQFQINPINNYPADFDRYWQFPFSYTQQQTFGEIAKAKAGDIAAEAGAGIYFLIVISGKGEDTDSKSYSAQEIKYLDNYRGAANINSLAVFRHRDSNIDFKVEFSEIDVTRIKPGTRGSQPRIIQPGNVSQKDLEILTPKGSRTEPREFSEKDKIFVQWRCLGCSDSSRFVIQISKLEGGERVSPITVFKQFAHSVPPLKAGLYDIKVSGDNLTSQRVYIKISGGGGWGWLIILLALGGLAVLARYVWKNFFRKEDEEEPAKRSIFDADRGQPQQNTSNIPPSQQGGGGQSSSSDYF